MGLLEKSKSLLLIVLLIMLVIVSCSNPEVSKKKEMKEYDYTEKSQEIEKVVEEHWFKQLSNFKQEESWEREEEKLVDDKKIIWEKDFQRLQLSFPSNPKQELDKLITDLSQKLAEVKAELKLKKRENINGENKVVLEVVFQPEEIPSQITVYQLNLTQPEVKAKMAFVIDDFGFNRLGTKQFLDINRQITVAVLPFRPYSTKEAKAFKEAGHQVLLHLPMEPISEANPGDGAIYTDMSEEEIESRISKDIAGLGVEVAGVNNHMGSKATADEKVMKYVLNYLQERDLFFIDSSTAPHSAVPVVAQQVEEPYALNHLFIDNVDTKKDVKKQINKLAKIALQRGELITVGHVRANTALALEEMIPKLEEMGIQLVYVSELVK